MSQPTGNGCAEWLAQIMIALAALTFFPFYMGISQTATPLITDEPALAVEVVLQPAVSTNDPLLLEQTAAVLEQRLENLGVNDYSVIINVDGTFSIQLETTLALDVVLDILTTVGLLEFVDFGGLSEQSAAYVGTTIQTSARISQFDEVGLAVEGALHPVTGKAFDSVLTSDSIFKAEAYLGDFGDYVVEVQFTEEGSTILGAYTEASIGDPLAIVLDGEVLTVPLVQSRLDTAVLITGNFTEAEAVVLAAQLNSSRLPLALTIISVEES